MTPCPLQDHLACDGTNYVGWQRQASGTSVQGLIRDALAELDGREVVLTAPVEPTRAFMRSARSPRALDRAIDPGVLMRALNARLPPDVRVVSAEAVAPDFHARFGATAKTYRYRIYNADVMSPFERHYAWHVFGALDVEAMDAAARCLKGGTILRRFRPPRGPRAQRSERFGRRRCGANRPW